MTTYDVLYQRRGDEYANRHRGTWRLKEKAFNCARNLTSFPDDTTNIVITSDEGETVYDFQKDGPL